MCRCIGVVDCVWLFVKASCLTLEAFAFAFAFGCGSWVFRGLPGLPLGSCFDSGLSWLPLACSPVGNGGIGASFLSEPPALCFACGLLSGDRSLCSVLCSDFSDVLALFLASSASFRACSFVGLSCLYWCSANSVIRP